MLSTLDFDFALVKALLKELLVDVLPENLVDLGEHPGLVPRIQQSFRDEPRNSLGIGPGLASGEALEGAGDNTADNLLRPVLTGMEALQG